MVAGIQGASKKLRVGRRRGSEERGGRELRRESKEVEVGSGEREVEC